MKKYTNDTGMSLPIAVWALMDNYNYDSRENVISVTSLMKPIRQIVLGKKNKDCEQIIESSNMIPSSMGTALHDSVEKAWNNKEKTVEILDSLGYLDSESMYDEVILERRSEKEVNGYIISGQFDIAFDGAVCDIKSTSVWSYIYGSKDDDYILQMSIYRWLNQDIITKDIGFIEYLFTDWSGVKAKQDKQYPQSRYVSKSLKLLSLEDTETYIINKLKKIDKYMVLDENDLIYCSDEDLWKEEDKWKVYNPNKSGKLNMNRASKVFENESDANNFVKLGGKVVKFGGGAKRCNYCNYTQICEQYVQLQLKGEIK